MTQPDIPMRHGEPAKFILHLTDFSESSEAAFAHALRLALNNHSTLTVMHIGDGKETDWDSFPSFRHTLQDWGLLEKNADRADVLKLGLRVRKIAVQGDDVGDVIADFDNKYAVDMVVMASEQRSRLEQWFRRKSFDAAALKSGVPALFVPARGRGCVASDDGHVTMRHVLIPVDHRPSPDAAIERGLRALTAFGDGESRLTLLYVGNKSDFPDVHVPPGPWKVARSVRNGDPAKEILAAAEETEADLMIMVSAGSDGVLDALRGTTTAQVLQKSPCPLLSIPADF